MVTKIFLATYVNMAVVALVAYGYLQNKPDLAKNVYHFQLYLRPLLPLSSLGSTLQWRFF